MKERYIWKRTNRRREGIKGRYRRRKDTKETLYKVKGNGKKENLISIVISVIKSNKVSPTLFVEVTLKLSLSKEKENN